MKIHTEHLFLMILFTIAFGCNGNLVQYSDAESVYVATFNSPPPQGITGLRATGFAFGDNSANYLRFKAPISIVNRLVGKTFAPITAATFASETSGAGITGPTPPWWAPTTSATTKYYSSTGFHPSFASGQAYYSYDSSSQLIHLYWDGLD